MRTAPATAGSGPGRHGTSLRWHLVGLVVSAVLPLVAFAALMVALFGRQEQASLERGLRDTTRALALALDRELATTIRSLEAIAASPLFDGGDIPALYEYIQRVRPTQPWWRATFVTRADGVPLFGSSPPRPRPREASIAERPYFRRAVRSRRPAFSDYIVAGNTGQGTISVVAPVMRAGTLRYVVGTSLDLRALGAFLAEQDLPPAWTGYILDRNGVVLARTGAGSGEVGEAAGPLLGRAVRSEGWLRGEDAGGRPMYLAYSRSAFSDWVVAIAVPAALVDGPARRSLAVVVGVGLALGAAGVGLALLLGRRIASAIGHLAEAARAVGRGASLPSLPGSSVAEVESAQAALAQAAALLAERERGRDRVEAAAREAEAHQRFLAETSARLAGSLDLADTLEAVARQATPHLADAAILDLLEPDGRFRTVAASHVDPGVVPRLLEMRRRFPPDPGSDQPEAAAVRSGHPQLLGPIGDRLLEQIARTPEHLALARRLEPRSALVVPLIVRQRILGTLLLLETAASGRRFGPEHLPLAAAFAERAALAIDNARLYEEAQAAVRAREAFLARASHELRTPLTSALATVHLLPRALTGSLRQPAAELVEIARRSLDAMLALVNRLLDASRLAAGGAPVAAEPIGVGALVARTLDLVRPQAQEASVTLAVRVPPGLVVLGDPLGLEQVLVNLLANAVKFTPAGGRVSVEAETAGGEVTLRVRDTGEGIAPEHLERVFEPFFQATRRTAPRTRGTGLGLAITRQIVAQHGGRVWAESEGAGRGSTFLVRLPLAPAAGQAA